jgi:hypothetical protein
MDHKPSPKKNYTFLGLITIIILAIVVLYSAIALTIAKIKYPVKNLQVTNLTANSATISWETDEYLPTEFRYIPSPNAKAFKVADDRGLDPSSTHVVTLTDLEPNTSYDFYIGNETFPVDTAIDNFTTQSVSDKLKSPMPIYGQISLESGNDSFKDVLVHYRAYDPNNEVYSDYYTAIPNEDGRWSGEIFSIRDQWGDQYFSDDKITSLLNLETMIAPNVLGETTDGSHESFSNSNGEASEMIEVLVTNGSTQNKSFTPISADISNEIITVYLNDIVRQEELVNRYAPEAPAAYCTQYQTYTLNYCSNTVCPTGRNCAGNALVNADVVKCVARSSSDVIADCCALGETIENGACVSPGQCTTYGSHTLNSCKNTACPTGRNCASQSLTGASNIKCLSRSNVDYIYDCCPSGYTIQNGACVAPGQCTTYGSHPLNSCTNTACPTGRNCSAQSLSGASNVKCLSRSSSDYIYDCCPSGSTIQNGVCVAPGQCTNYGSNPLNTCTNTACPTGRNCKSQSLSGASNVKCLSRSSVDYIYDCCPSGYNILNGVCVAPGQCTNYGSNPLNSCTNTACPTGRNCAAQSLTNATNVRCLSRTSSDNIYDCCASGATIQNGACVAPGQCTNYGSNPINTCTNTACPTGRNCASQSLTNATNVKCLSRSSVDYIYDCCASGATIENGACVMPGQCTTYGDHDLNSCTNNACPSGRYCSGNSLSGADTKLCVNRGGGKDQILDCCPAGYTISGTSCVPSGSVTPTVTTTGSITPTGSITASPSPTPTQVPVNGCTILGGDKPTVMQTGQRIIDEQIVPFISSQTGYAPFPITFVISGSGKECSTGDSHQITCGLPSSGDIWLTGKLIFHEVMHNYRSVYGTKPNTVISELMASLMEGYFTRESCMGGEYTFYGLGDGNHEKGRKPDLIRNNSGLSAGSLWQFAITGNSDMFTSAVVNRIVPGGWKFEHIFCSGYKQWATYYDGIGCSGDTPRAVTDTFDINMDILLSPNKLNDFEEGEYRLDLSYKTLTNNANETDKTVPVRLNNGCSAGDPSCQINDVPVANVYVNSEAQNDPRYDLSVSLNSDVKNDLNCWNRDVDMQPSQESPINMELNIQDMSCSYSFGGIPVECEPKDLSTEGIVAPWKLASGASQSQGYSSSHPGVDVTAEDGSTLVAAQDGTVIATRRGAVKDSIYFDSVRWGTKCEEGSRLNPSNWVCLCDWCPLDKVRAQAPNRPDVCNAQRDCVARAEELQRSSPDWSVDGALHRIYGNFVIIEHANHRSIYSHMGNINVAPGNCVKAGDVIGTMSSTGSSSGPHVHFEVRTIAGTIISPSGLRCTGDGCSIMGFMPGSNSYPNFLGLATDELPDFYEGDIDLTDQRPLTFNQGVYEFASPVGNTTGLIAKQDALKPTIFIDSNGNNKADEGETKLASGALENLTQIEGLQDIRLNDTWNLIVFKASSPSIVTTKDLAKLAELSGMHLEIASYDMDRWNISTIKQEGSEMVFYGNEVNILPQRAFFIRSSAPGTYYHSGEIPTATGDQLELQAGWNFFSLSSAVIEKNAPSSYSILQACNANGISCSLFSDFNGQLENPVIYRGEFYGKDYKLEAGKGYVLKVESNPGTISF